MRKVLNIFVVCVLTFSLSTLAYAEPRAVNEEDFKPLAITLINPSIRQAIDQYYEKKQKPTPSYGLYDIKILELKRGPQEAYSFRVVLEVSTYYGAHNPPNSTEVLTFDVDPGKVKLINHIHKAG